jgi:hypothetical protein
VQLLEDPDHADVGDAAGAASRKDEDEFRLFRKWFLGYEGSAQRENE